MNQLSEDMGLTFQPDVEPTDFTPKERNGKSVKFVCRTLPHIKLHAPVFQKGYNLKHGAKARKQRACAFHNSVSNPDPLNAVATTEGFPVP